MRTIGRLALIGVIAIAFVPAAARAQTPPPAAPGQAQPDERYPYAPPPNFVPPPNLAPPAGFPRQGQVQEQVPELAQEPAPQGPEITEVPGAIEAPPSGRCVW